MLGCSTAGTLSCLVLPSIGYPTRGTEVNDIACSLGPLGLGSRQFRCWLTHSSGKIYIGTYGPQPGYLWEYDPTTGQAEVVAKPGPYQIDAILEGPDGHLYMTTCYEGHVVEFDPVTRQATDHIFEKDSGDLFDFYPASDGRAYLSRHGVLWAFDPQDKTFTRLGETPLGFSDPRLGKGEMPAGGRAEDTSLGFREMSDGWVYFCTRPGIFSRFHLQSGAIERIEAADPEGTVPWGLVLYNGDADTEGWVYGLAPSVNMPIFGYTAWEHGFLWRYHISTHVVQCYYRETPTRTIATAAFDAHTGHLFSVEREGHHTYVLELEPESGIVLHEWPIAYEKDFSHLRRASPRHFHLLGATRLMELDTVTGKATTLFNNPVPAEIRSLTIDAQGRLYGQSYDLGNAHRFDPRTGVREDLGPFYTKVHRAAYGMLALSRDERYLLGNINGGSGISGTLLRDLETGEESFLSANFPASIVSGFDGLFYGVHRGVYYIHHTSGSWDGSGDTPAWLAHVGLGVYKVNPATKTYQELSGIPVGQIMPAPGSGFFVARGNVLYRWDATRGLQEVTRTGSPSIYSAAPQANCPIGKIATGNDGTLYLAFGDSLLYLKPNANCPAVFSYGVDFNCPLMLPLPSGRVFLSDGHRCILTRSGEFEYPRVVDYALPGRVQAVADPIEDVIYTVHTDVHRIAMRDLFPEEYR